MLKFSASPVWRTEFFRFVTAGLINTAVTLLAFEGLRRMMPYLVAYSLTYAFGIVLSYALNVAFVFQTKRSVRTAALFPMIYAVQYLVGAAMMWLMVSNFALHPTLALALTVGMTIPITFILSRTILRSS